MSIRFNFDNSYARLPERFYTRQPAEPVRDPKLLALNTVLARELGLDPEALATPEGVSVLAGNIVPDGADPLAQAYAGHQFGSWNPQLGDGRAVLLGEVLDRDGLRHDIQLKGSGLTGFSRMGTDGRAWIGPVLREYLVSEAMHAMAIPTTRALAAVATGEPVIRERALPGAVLTRVASSHLRVGTFQYFAARRDEEAVRLLVDHAISRHYPEAQNALEFLDAVVARQAALIAAWMSVGFIHGVMNTDNCHIGGETIDYGPCAFMDRYNARQVFSSIDHFGRYAYDQQARIAAWNLAQLATAILPLIDDDTDRAIKVATASVHRFQPVYEAVWLDRFRAKLGLRGAEPEDGDLIVGLLERMEKAGADFTNFFADLAEGDPRAACEDPAPLDDWWPDFEARLRRHDGMDRTAMATANPQVIPRNHQVEAVIAAAVRADMAPFETLLTAVTQPNVRPDPALRAPPRAEEEIAATYCGT